MGNNQGRQLSRGRSRSKILSPRERKEKGLLKKSKSQPITSSSSSTPTSSPTRRTFTKREDKRPIDPDEEEDEEFNDILSDEHEFTTSPIEFYEESITIVYNEGIKLLTKQKLLQLQIDVLRGIQEMCDVTLPVAAILLYRYSWDKDALIEKWIDNIEDVCKGAGVLLPLVPKKEDTTNIDDIFIPFKEEEKPPLLMPYESSQGDLTRNGYNVRLLDIIRPFLVQRTQDSDDDTVTLNNFFAGPSSSGSSVRRSLRQPPPLPPASPRVPRRNRSHHPSSENLDDMEVAAVQLSLISNVQELFPELDEPFIAACLQEYRNSSERVVHHILEGGLPPALAERLRILRNGQSPPPPPIITEIEDVQPSQREDEGENANGAGGEHGAEEAGNEQTYLGYDMDGASANVASDPQFHSTAGTHEDFTENPNNWFSATHTEAENESVDSFSYNMHQSLREAENEGLDSLSTTNTFTYNVNYSRVGTPRVGIRSINYPHHSEVLHTEGTEDIFVDNFTGGDGLTSENTSHNVFDNDTEDEEELVVRRHKSKKGDLNDMSEYNDMSDMDGVEDKADALGEAQPVTPSETGNDTSDTDGVEDKVDRSEEPSEPQPVAVNNAVQTEKLLSIESHNKISSYDSLEHPVDASEDSDDEDDEKWKEYVKICEPTTQQNEAAVQMKNEDVYIVPFYDEAQRPVQNCNEQDVVHLDVPHNTDDTIIIEVPEEEDVERDFKDIDLCMKDIANAFVDNACNHDHSLCVDHDHDHDHDHDAVDASTDAVPDVIVVTPADDNKGEEVTCPVCYVDIPVNEAYGLACNHLYCLDCWRSHLQTKLGEGLVAALSAACMYPQCKVSVDVVCWRKVLDEAQFAKFQWFFLKAFVDNCPKATWCSNPVSCSSAAYYQGVDIPTVLEVKCECGWKFCFHCGEEAHRPCSCKQLSNWQTLRFGEEGQNALWLSHNTKRCPQCQVHIEKNEGCMHLTCKMCRHEFCWLCKGAWSEHGDKTGGYYSCNRYDPLRHDTPDLDIRFGKYVHHFQRFTYHSNARKVAENRRPDISCREPSCAPGDDPWDRAFLYDALDLISSCRNVLKYTYVFGYYLDDSNEKELFEFLQEDLEKSTEHLTELTFREIENITAPIAERECIALLKNSTKVTRKFLHNLLSGIQNGLTAEYGPPADVIAAAKHKNGKKLKDRKISRLLTKSKISKPTTTTASTTPTATA